MGGFGSGNRIRIGARDIVEHHRRLDIRQLARNNCLQPSTTGKWAWWNDACERTASINFRVKDNQIKLSFAYRENGGEWAPVEQTVFFDWTPCNFGGYRYWFLCPGCGRRVAILYAAGKYFLCRHCYRLTYASSQESGLDRLMRKSRKIRRRLGASEALSTPIVCKPRDMHQRTFNELRIEVMRIENKINQMMAKQLGIRI